MLRQYVVSRRRRHSTTTWPHAIIVIRCGRGRSPPVTTARSSKTGSPPIWCKAEPVLFLENANGAVMRSDTLATAITERPARVRVFGELRMAALNSTAFIAITGNGLTVSEDLARRCIACKLDAGCEDPESRPFGPGFLERVEQDRVQLLSAAVTVWRFGRAAARQL